MSLREAVGLLAMIRGGGTEDLRAIQALDTWTTPFAPAGLLGDELVRELFGAGLVGVDPRSDLDAFDWETGEPERFYLARVDWIVPGPNERRPIQVVGRGLEEIFRTGQWPEAWRSDVHLLWRQLALHEALAYFTISMNDHHLPISIGNKTILVFEETLERFSIGQTYSFIWRAARDAAAYYQRGGVHKNHAANSAIGNIQRMAERATAEGWQVSRTGEIGAARNHSSVIFSFRAVSNSLIHLPRSRPLAPADPAG